MIDLNTSYTVTKAARLLGITPRRVRQLSASFGIGTKVFGRLLFTPAEFEQMRQRRTDRAPIRCWLRDRAKQLPHREEPDKT